MKYLILITLLLFSISVIGQDKAIITKKCDGKKAIKIDTLQFDQSLTDSTLSGIMVGYVCIGRGRIYWRDGIRNKSNKDVFFFTRQSFRPQPIRRF